MGEPRDPTSRPAVLSKVVGLATVPDTQTSLQYGSNELWDVFMPDSAAAGSAPNSTMGWYAPGRNDAMTDLNESYIKVTGYFAYSADQIVPDPGGAAAPNVEPTTDITTAPFLAASIFNDLEITVNGTVVYATQGNAQPYAAVAGIIRSQSYADRETGDYTKGYILDAPGQAVAGVVSAVANAGGFSRQTLYLSGTTDNMATRQFSLTVRIADLGFRTHTWLPPNAQIRVRARRAKSPFLIKGPTAAVAQLGATFTMTDANLLLSRKKLDDHALMSLNRWWLTHDAKIPYTKVQTSVNSYGPTVTSIYLNNQLAGKTPDAVYAFILTQSALNGTSDGEEPAYNLGTAKWSQASIQVGGGRTYPMQPLSQTPLTGQVIIGNAPTLDFSEVYQMYLSTCNASPFLKASDFTNIAPLCFQIGSRADGAWDLAEDTSISFKGVLSEALGYNYALLLVSFTESVIAQSSVGQITAF